MWNAIRSDLQEFATSIATDGNTVLENIDTKLKETDILQDGGRATADENDDSSNENRIKDALLAVDPEVASTAIASSEQGGQTTRSSETVDDAVYDAMLADAQIEAYRRMEMLETYLTPLLNSELNGVKGSDEGLKKTDVDTEVDATAENQKDQEEEANANTFTESVDEQAQGDDDDEAEEGTKADEADVDNEDDKQDDENLVEEDDGDKEDDDDDEEDEGYEEAVKEYLASFDIQSKTDEISELLSQQPFLSQHFENLVPVQVTYEQFWQRYFYRCDPVRIVKEWEEEDERLRLQRQELIGKGVKSVQNMFGGALKAIKGVTTVGQEGKNGTGTSIYEKYQAELEEKKKAMLLPQGDAEEEKKTNLGSGLLGGALGMFGGNNGRPPFVLNTAESGDDEEVYENQDDDELDDEEEEEEELSWGSDDEDNDEYEEEEDEYEDDVENDDMNEPEQETIVFEDKLTTSDGVIQEIENLKAMLEEAQGSKHEAETKVQKLEKQLDQLNEQIEQERSGHAKLLEEEISKVRNEERTRVSALEDSTRGEVDDAVKKITKQLDEMQSLKYEAEAKARELEVELHQCKEESKLENEKMSRLMVEERDQLEGKHATEMKSAEAVINDLRAQLESSQLMAQKERDSTKELENELHSCKEELKKQSIDFAKTLEDEVAKARTEAKVAEVSPSLAQEGDSMSSGVEIPPANEPTQQAEEESEDGWGDSWSDDE